jgi:histidinol dehydrogenase
MKRTSLLGCGPASFAALAEPAMTLAKVEGLEAHACAAALRLVAYKQDADNER